MISFLFLIANLHFLFQFANFLLKNIAFSLFFITFASLFVFTKWLHLIIYIIASLEVKGVRKLKKSKELKELSLPTVAEELRQ